jgi:hypothetical protein
LFTSLFQDKEVNGFGQSPIEKITKRLFEAQLCKSHSNLSKTEEKIILFKNYFRIYDFGGGNINET